MNFKVKYAVLKYVPNIERNERINIAIVLHNPETRQIKMTIINNWKRVSDFDDEADIKFLKKYVEDLQEQFSDNLFNDFDGMSLNDENLLDEMTKYFVNKFVFEIHEIYVNEKFDTLLENIKKVYLHYDISKDKRQKEDESKAIVEKYLLENSLTYEKHGIKNSIQEEYGNNINFDYKIKDKYYKIICLTQENYNGYVAMLKMWIANCIMLKKENKKLIFIVDDNVQNEKTKSYIKMLDDYSNVITIQEFVKLK